MIYINVHWSFICVFQDGSAVVTIYVLGVDQIYTGIFVRVILCVRHFHMYMCIHVLKRWVYLLGFLGWVFLSVSQANVLLVCCVYLYCCYCIILV